MALCTASFGIFYPAAHANDATPRLLEPASNTLFSKAHHDIYLLPIHTAINFRLNTAACRNRTAVDSRHVGGSRRRNRLTRLRPDSRVARNRV